MRSIGGLPPWTNTRVPKFKGTISTSDCLRAPLNYPSGENMVREVSCVFNQAIADVDVQVSLARKVSSLLGNGEVFTAHSHPSTTT